MSTPAGARLDRRIALLTLLYFCQGLPGGFLAVALPVILLQQGVDLTRVGFVSALSLPWALKLLWAPWVDRRYSRRIGRRRSWMLPAMLVMLLCTASIGALDPSDSLVPILALFGLLNLAAATQDIAVDGYAVSLLRDRELATGNAAQVGGFKLGNLVGGGVLLAASGWLGWGGVFAIMSGCIAAAFVAVLVLREPSDDRVPSGDTWALVRSSVRTLLRRPAFVAFLVAAKFGESSGGVLVKPAMVQHGFTRELIGTLDGVLGSIATIAGAGLGGVLARRLGWARCFVSASCLQGAALVVLAFYQAGEVTPLGFGLRAALEHLGGGAVAVAVFMLAMSRCSPEAGGVDFTAAQVTYMLGAALAGPIASALADAVGITPVMAAGGVLTVAIAWLGFVGRERIAAPLTADPGADSRSG